MKQALQTALVLITIFAVTAPAFAREQRTPRGARGDGPAWEHWQQQHKENVAFRQTLTDMEPVEAIQAIIDHRQIQHRENLAFCAEQKDRRIEQINSRERLTEEQKAELVSFVEVMYGKKVAFFTELHDELLEVLKELADEEDVTIENIRQALRDFHEEAKAKIEAFRAEQWGAWKEKLEEVIGPRPRRGARNQD